MKKQDAEERPVKLK